MTLMTQVEYARHIGKTKQYVGKLVKSGKIPMTADRKIDSDVADAALKRNSDPARSQMMMQEDHESLPAPEADKQSYASVRTNREIIKTKFEEMKLRRVAGELVDVADVASVLKDVFRDLRDRLQGLPTQAKGRLVSMHDEREIQIYLNDLIQSTLEDISNRAFERVENVRASS